MRITHWTIAVAVILNALVTEGGSTIHVWIGYVAVAMLALRLLWGLIGTEEARFVTFAPSLSAARAHVSDMFARRHRTYRSHNPLGSLMVFALWGTLTVVAATGITMAGSPFDTRPAAASENTEAGENDGDEGESVIAEVHEVAGNLLLILAIVHVGGVALESRLSGRNLPAEMITGRRRAGTD